MDNLKYVIVGGGVAGTTAAATIRQHDSSGLITIVSKEPHSLYSRPSLAGYMRGEHSREAVFLRGSEFYKRYNLDLVFDEAIGINTADKFVTISNERQLGYDRLLIASGSRPKEWHTPGAHLSGVESLRTIEDAERIAGQIKTARRVVVVGGGFITLELVQVLSKVGVATDLIIRGDYYWQNVLDQESGSLLRTYLQQVPNLTVHYQTTVEHVLGEDAVTGVVLSNGKKIDTSLVLTSIGIDFNTEWLQGSELEIERGLVVNQFLQTEDKDIFAAGDIALFYDPLVGMYHHQGNWNNASLHGQIAGQNMVGHTTEYSGVTSYSISFMGKNISFIGQTSIRSSVTAIPRGSARLGSHSRILIKNDRVIGATLINRFTDRDAISRLISAQVPVSNHLMELTDESYPLYKLADRLGA